jgi:hypothetical protein
VIIVKDIVSDNRLRLTLSNFCWEFRRDFAERSTSFSFIKSRKFGDGFFAKEFGFWCFESFVISPFLLIEYRFTLLLELSIDKFIDFIEILFIFWKLFIIEFVLILFSFFYESRVKFFHEIGVFSAEEFVELICFVPENEVVEVENGFVLVVFKMRGTSLLFIFLFNFFFLSSNLRILTIHLEE